MLISRQVDNLAIGCTNADSIRKLVAIICSKDKIDLRNEGILESFNGIDVKQTQQYIQITCEPYIDKFLTHYGWSSAVVQETSDKPIEPLALSTIPQLFADYDANANADANAILEFETAAGFVYRSVLGAIMHIHICGCTHRYRLRCHTACTFLGPPQQDPFRFPTPSRSLSTNDQRLGPHSILATDPLALSTYGDFRCSDLRPDFT